VDLQAHAVPIQMQDTTLSIAGKPFLPRSIEWNGEPLAFLAERGFNAVHLAQPPTADLTSEAQRADLWFICSPPRPDTLAARGLGPSLDRILAWDLGAPGDRELDYYRHWAELVRDRDPAPHRPILMAPQSDWLPASKIADVITVGRADSDALATAEFAQWLQERSKLARPGTPFWAVLPTQPSRRVLDQLKILAPTLTTTPLVNPRRVETLAMTAATQGCRGFLFQSTTPLNASDDSSRRRALAAELINQRLQFLEPWLTLGSNSGQLESVGTSASATVLQVERTRLLVVDADSSAAPRNSRPPATPASITFIVPGVPDSNQAYSLSETQLEPVAGKRVAGGLQISVDRGAIQYVLITEDTNVIANFRQRIARDGLKFARLERDLLATRVRLAVLEVEHLAAAGLDTSEFQRAAATASAQITRCDALLNSGRAADACQIASDAHDSLCDAADQQQMKLTGSPPLADGLMAILGEGVSAPIEIQRTLKSVRPSDNKISGGDFEDLAQLMQLGWQHVNQPLPGIEAKAELSADKPHTGRYSLQLSAQPTSSAAAPQIVARPLARITSPPIHLETGQLLEIAGWVRVQKPIVGNIDGLTITDTLGGLDLAIHVRETADWQPFRLIRAASVPADESVSFLLTGLGNASIDDVTVRLLGPPTSRRLPATSTAPAAPSSQSAGLPLLAAPINQR
jgi:hypothetical protein